MSDPLPSRTPSEAREAAPPPAPPALDAAYARSAVYTALAVGFGPPGPPHQLQVSGMVGQQVPPRLELQHRVHF